MQSNYEISHRTMGFGGKSYILAAGFNCGMGIDLRSWGFADGM
jgi:hypothetical protein